MGWDFYWSKRPLEPYTDGTILKGIFTEEELEGLIEYEVIEKGNYVFMHLVEIAPHNRGHERRHMGVAGMLFAFAATEAFNAGFNGFVALVPKAKYYNYYQTKYGAKPIFGTDRLFLLLLLKIIWI